MIMCHAGYVQTPRYDGQVHYPREMNSKVVLQLPPGHSVMLSFPALDIGGQCHRASDWLKMNFFSARATGQVNG